MNDSSPGYSGIEKSSTPSLSHASTFDVTVINSIHVYRSIDPGTAADTDLPNHLYQGTCVVATMQLLHAAAARKEKREHQLRSAKMELSAEMLIYDNAMN